MPTPKHRPGGTAKSLSNVFNKCGGKGKLRIHYSVSTDLFVATDGPFLRPIWTDTIGLNSGGQVATKAVRYVVVVVVVID